MIMIDDKKSNLEDMHITAAKFGIAYQGFHYRYLEPLIAGFNMHSANHQLSLLHPKLPTRIQEQIIDLELIQAPFSPRLASSLFSKSYLESIPEVPETTTDSPKPQ